MSIEPWYSWETWASILHIFLVNLVLSADNALVIALAAHRLPAAQRRLAILWGGAVAIVLRVLLTFLAAYLLRLPGLMLVGGLVLFWIAVKLMVEEDAQLTAEKSDSRNLFMAVRMIAVTDLVMSLDNALAVAGASGGDGARMLLGLLLSVTIIVLCSQLIATVMDRLPWLVYAGGAVLSFTAAEMMLSSREAADFCTHFSGVGLSERWEKWMVEVPVIASCVCWGYWLRKRQSRAKPEKEQPDLEPFAVDAPT